MKFLLAVACIAAVSAESLVGATPADGDRPEAGTGGRNLRGGA